MTRSNLFCFPPIDLIMDSCTARHSGRARILSPPRAGRASGLRSTHAQAAGLVPRHAHRRLDVHEATGAAAVDEAADEATGPPL